MRVGLSSASSAADVTHIRAHRSRYHLRRLRLSTPAHRTVAPAPATEYDEPAVSALFNCFPPPAAGMMNPAVAVLFSSFGYAEYAATSQQNILELGLVRYPPHPH